jgi:hypothetical protein
MPMPRGLGLVHRLLQVVMNEGAMPPMVLVIATKKVARTIAKELPDVADYTHKVCM